MIEDILKRLADRTSDSAIYARIIPHRDKTYLQYWFYRYYNSWANEHEGDWEMIQGHFIK